jgi:hypothetical protein
MCCAFVTKDTVPCKRLPFYDVLFTEKKCSSKPFIITVSVIDGFPAYFRHYQYGDKYSYYSYKKYYFQFVHFLTEMICKYRAN